MEKTPSPEKASSEKAQKSQKEILRDFFNRYRIRPDTPKYSYEEQSELGKKSEEARKKFTKEGTPEAEQESKAAAEEFLESKADKKHVSTMWAPLAAAQYFLGSEEAKEISEANRTELLNKIGDLLKKLEEARQKQHISDELVAEALDFMDEMEAVLHN